MSTPVQTEGVEGLIAEGGESVLRKLPVIGECRNGTKNSRRAG